MNATTNQVTTFLRFTATSTGALVRAGSGGFRAEYRVHPDGADGFVPWVTQVPSATTAARRSWPSRDVRSAAGKQVLTGRSQRQVGVDAVAQVDQLQLL